MVPAGLDLSAELCSPSRLHTHWNSFHFAVHHTGVLLDLGCSSVNSVVFATLALNKLLIRLLAYNQAPSLAIGFGHSGLPGRTKA